MRVERPDLSIVVPTHRRPAILQTCLEHLGAQTTRDQLEVIVVSDGHDPDTAAMFEGHKKDAWGLPVTFIEIEKSQQGKARNVGVRQAKADTVLFAQDDIFLAPDACDEHLLSHAALQYAGEQDVAVLGYTCWDPAIKPTKVMRWLDDTGWQFGYPKLEGHEEDFVPPEIQHRFTYTSHLSVPTAIAKRVTFREDVFLYGWEDVEWGLRLAREGVRLFYLPTAKALHHHHLDMAQSLKRMETLGESLVTLSRINPSLDRLPKGWKRMAYHCAAMLPTMRGRHANAFLKGIRKEERAA